MCTLCCGSRVNHHLYSVRWPSLESCDLPATSTTLRLGVERRRQALCGGRGDPLPWWRSSLVEPGIKVTVDDEDMTPSDTTIAYKVSLLLLFHSDFWYNSLGSTCTCLYLLVGANISQSASPSKLLCHRHGLVIHNWDPGPS